MTPVPVVRTARIHNGPCGSPLLCMRCVHRQAADEALLRASDEFYWADMPAMRGLLAALRALADEAA